MPALSLQVVESDESIRHLPHAHAAERSILSTMMQEDVGAEYLELAQSEGLEARDFYTPSHGLVFLALADMHERGLPIEPVGLMHRLRERGDLENIGGPAEIGLLHAFSPTAAFFDHHLEVVTSKAIQRNGITALMNRTASLYGTEDPDGELDATKLEIDSILARRHRDILVGSAMAVSGAVDALSERLAGNADPTLPTPWGRLNGLLGGGIGLGEITVVAARPSMGKTSWVLNLLEHIAQAGSGCALLSLESDERALTNRRIAAEARVCLQTLTRGDPDMLELERVKRSCEEMAERPFWMRRLRTFTRNDLSTAIRCAVRQHGVRVIAIDYLQKVQPATKGESDNARLRIDNALGAICPLAKELGVALVVLAQLSREAEGKFADQLHMGMLKESSGIEQDADTIIFLGSSREEAREEDQDPDVELIDAYVPKNRDGPTSFARLVFLKRYVTFHDRA